jgi:hypothetical protein
MQPIRILLVAAAASLLGSCKSTDAQHAQVLAEADSPATPGRMPKSAWLAKVGRVLRNQSPLDDEQYDRLASKSEPEIVDELMQDPKFMDTILAFNLFYLGRPVNRLVTETAGGATYDPIAFAVPNALASAQAAFTDGDYFELFRTSPPLYGPRPEEPRLFQAGSPSATDGAALQDLADPVVRNRDLILTKLGDLAGDKYSMDPAPQTANDEGFSGFPPASPWCTQWTGLDAELPSVLQASGFPVVIAQSALRLWVGEATGTGFLLQRACGFESLADGRAVRGELRDQAKEHVRKVRDRVAKMFESLPRVAQVAKTGSVPLWRYEAGESDGLPSLSDIFTPESFWSPLPSSFSNKNRKRSAYMLRTFFCEDMVPVEVGSLQQVHTAGASRHASERACKSCHYKLDPMGALFRFRGRRGADLTGTALLEFDDGNPITGESLTRHLSTWEEGGALQAGYYVDFDTPHGKWRGDSLEDLFAFLPQSDEARLCLTRRLAEFVLGTQQVYDGGWLQSLSQELKPGADSGKGLKAVVKRLVTSETFRRQDPVQGECYDFTAASAAPAGAARPPCEINHLIQRRCYSCHRSAAANPKLTTWQPVAGDPQGRSWFVHKNENGEQLSIRDSAREILQWASGEKLREGEPEPLTMPPGGVLPLRERDALIRWLKRYAE